MVAREKPGDGVVRTEAGLLVPGHALRDATVDASGAQPVNLAPIIADAVLNRKRQTAYDPDDRRRVGLTKAEAKAIDKAFAMLNDLGIGVILACSARFDGKDPCRGFLTPEGRRGRDQDAGYGCTCSRLHFLGV